MNKRQHDYRIHMSTARAKLASDANYTSRTEPFWRSLGKGVAIGWRKSAVNGGSWIARYTDPSHEYHYKSLGRVDEVSYDDAEQAAQVWFDQCRGGVMRSGTVEDACKQYVANQRNEKGERAANFSELRFKQLVYGKDFGNKKLDGLTTREIEAWRDSLVTDERKKSSANRVLRTAKAALNFAFQRGMCPSDAAWRRVKPLKGEGARDRQRTAYLTPMQRQRLIAKADGELADFLRGLLLTGARPNELAAAKVSDFDARQRTLRLMSLKGQGDERERHVPLSAAGMELFKRMVKDKLPAAPIFSSGPDPWLRHQWSRGIRAALEAANADAKKPAERIPADTVAYTMRHCAITDMLRAGVGIGDVAKIAGTSIAMINSHYHKFIITDVREKLAAITAF